MLFLQIIAGSLLFNFPAGLEYPTLVAADAIRYLPTIVLTHAIVFNGLWWLGTAAYRLYGGGMRMFVIVPINVIISLLAVVIWSLSVVESWPALCERAPCYSS
jgi:hypothetical protein